MKAKIKIFIPLILFVLACAIITVIAIPFVRKLADVEFQAAISDFVKKIGVWGPILLVLAQVLQVVVAFIPGEPFEILAGVLYGPWWGLFLCIAGSALASAVIFKLSEKYGRRIMNLFFGEKSIKEWNWLHDGKKIDMAVFILFLIPGTPKDMLTYIVGVSDIGLKKFLILSSLARIPSVISSTMVGSAVRQGDVLSSVIVFIVIGLIGVLGILFKDKILNKVKKENN